MRLIIAEKKSLADAIAAAYTCKKTYEKQSIVAGDDVIAWSAGHILRQKNPDEYDPKYKLWVRDTLPIIPENYDDMLVPREDTMALFNNLKALLKKADSVVNAGDADREGQLLIDEILNYCGYKKPVYRLLLTDLSPDAVRKALASMKNNKEYRGVYEAGLGRQRADWIYGMNLSRVYTITSETKLGRALSVGRVQTPTLALVVNRDKEIENFVSKPYFVVYGDFDVADSSSNPMTAKWQPFGEKGLKKEDKGTVDREGFDRDGRIIEEAIVDALESKVRGKQGVIKNYKRGVVKKAPKAPYSLPQLEIDASSKYGIAPKETLAICQKLYEAKILTYPRSDCAYLPMSVYADREKIIKAAEAILEKCKKSGLKAADVADFTGMLDVSLKRSCFNDSKVEEHFAIIPTGNAPTGDLEKRELQVLLLVAKRFISLFLPDAEYAKAECGVEVEGEFFSASSKKMIKAGWKAIYGNTAEDEEEDEDEENKNDDVKTEVPETENGTSAVCGNISSKNKETTPPNRFTEATLLKAMNSVYSYVKDPEIKKVLKEVQGIGTAATQASIISELIDKRGFIAKEKKSLVSTPAGRSLIESLPLQVTVPDMTALWEMQLGDIAHNDETLDAFMADVINNVTELVNDRLSTAKVVERGGGGKREALKAITCPACGTKGSCKQYEGKYGKYWKCECGFVSSGATAPKVSKCPYCGAMLQRVKKKTGGYFWACSDKENCGKFVPDSNGQPGFSWCPKCKQIGKDAVTLRFLSKDGKRYYWRCQDCGSFFDDNKGFLSPKM